MSSTQNEAMREDGKRRRKRKRSTILIDTVESMKRTVLKSPRKLPRNVKRTERSNVDITRTYYRRTNDSFAKYIKDSRESYLLASGKPKTLYDNINDHTCNQNCDFWASDVPCNHIWDLYLCKLSLNAHPCGPDCESYVDGNDGMSCYLTGRYLGVVVENNLKRMKCWKDDDVCYTPPSKHMKDENKSFSHKLESIRKGKWNENLQSSLVLFVHIAKSNDHLTHPPIHIH